MPFKCAICELDIQTGEPMLSDERMQLSHESCVRRRLKDPGSSVVVPPPPPPAPPLPHPIVVETRVSGPGFGNPTASTEPCLMPSRAPAVCVECQKPAISMCPACLAYVHQSFGYNGPACSLNHEQRCGGARSSRELLKSPPALKPSGPIYDTIEIISVPTNGRHKTAKPKRKARR